MQTLVFLLFESFPSPPSEISNYPLLPLAAPQPVFPLCAESSASSLSLVVALLRASRASLVDRTEIAAFKPFKPKRAHVVYKATNRSACFFLASFPCWDSGRIQQRVCTCVPRDETRYFLVICRTKNSENCSMANQGSPWVTQTRTIRCFLREIAGDSLTDSKCAFRDILYHLHSVLDLQRSDISLVDVFQKQRITISRRVVRSAT